MAILKKDGTPYKLAKPNPMLNSQSLWERELIRLHNFTFPDFVTNIISSNKLEESTHMQEMKELEFTPIQDIEPETLEVPIKEVDPNKIPTRKGKSDVPKIQAYCLPAETQSTFDPLYREKRVKTLYGSQFSFELVLIASGDLMIQAWTNAPVTRESIIFIPDGKRWWRIEEVIEKYNGLLFVGVPSEITPSFQVQQQS